MIWIKAGLRILTKQSARKRNLFAKLVSSALARARAIIVTESPPSMTSAFLELESTTL